MSIGTFEHGLLLCQYLKNCEPGNCSRLELLTIKFSTKYHYKTEKPKIIVS
jgi:hypothetical protein